MSKFRVAIILMLLCSLLVSVAAAEETSTEALPGSGYKTGIQIQNVGTANATIELTGYDLATGAAQTASSQTAAPGASVNFVNYPAGGASSFEGSGVVSADQPIVGIVNVTNSGVNFAAAQYQATDGASVATTLNFPLVKNNLASKCTTFYVQNAGTADATLTATYSNGSSQTVTGVKPGQTALIDPASATPALTGGPFALTVSSGQPLAGVVLEHFCATGTLLQATRGFVSSDADSTLLSPIFKQKFPASSPRNNGLQVQNVSGGAIDISVTFTCASGACTAGSSVTHTASNVANGASATFFNNAVIANGSTTAVPTAQQLKNGALYSATATAKQAGTNTPANIVAINNESYDATVTLRNTATTFSALGLNKASSKVGIPLVKELFANNTTGIQVQNASSSAAVTVQVVYQMTNAQAGATCTGTYTLSNVSIAAGSSVTLYQPSVATPPAGATWGASGKPKAGCFGGATVTVTSASGSVVAVVQEADVNPNAAARLDNKNYEGFSIQ